jgi:polyhydroxybutyrate depolymerase
METLMPRISVVLRRLSVLLLLLALAPPAWSQQRKEPPPDQRRTVKVKDSTRAYYVHFPAGSRAAPWPLVLLLHPAGSDAREAMTVQRWREAADENGFILVGLEARTPNSLMPAIFSLNPRVWNSGDPGVHEQNILDSDDVAYAAAVLDQLMGLYTLDISRLYAAGFSSGGGMAQRLAVELPGRFAAIASVGALRAQPGPARGPLSVMLVYGKLDPVTPYDGGTRHTPWGDRTGMPPVSGTIAAWVRDLHCGGQAAEKQVNEKVTSQAWSGCDGGGEVQALTIADEGHHWTGSLPDGLSDADAGPVSRAYDDTQAIWAFFAAHPRGVPRITVP